VTRYLSLKIRTDCRVVRRNCYYISVFVATFTLVAKKKFISFSRTSVSPHISAVSPLFKFMRNLILKSSKKVCRENKNLIKIGQKYRALCLQTNVLFIVTGEIKSPQKRSLRTKWWQIVRVAEEV
jgi:isochorismate hydrolase